MRKKKQPVRVQQNMSFKEKRAKAMVDRRLRDRDTGGWAAEWNTKQGDHKFWSTLSQKDWMNKKLASYAKGSRRPSSSKPGSKSRGYNRPMSANPYAKLPDQLVSNASYIARAMNPEIS